MGGHCLCGPASQSPVHCGDVTEPGKGNVSSCPVQLGKAYKMRPRKGARGRGSGVNPAPGCAQAPPTPGFQFWEPGWTKAACWSVGRVCTSHQLPRPEPLPPRLESGPPRSWTARQASGMPGMGPAAALATDTPACRPCVPLQLLLQRRGEGHSSGQLERASCWPGLPPYCGPRHWGPGLPCLPGRGQWSQSRLPSAAPVTVTLPGG